MIRHVIGLDLALSTGMAVVRADGCCMTAKQILAPEKLKRYDKATWIANGIMQNMPPREGRLVLIEDYAVGHASSAVAVIELGAIIRYNLAKAGLEWINVPPSTLKKWTTGKGNAKKDAMLVAVRERWGQWFQVHDVADAYALARLGFDPDLMKIKGVSKNDR